MRKRRTFLYIQPTEPTYTADFLNTLFEWISSHVGISRNESVDLGAKNALKKFQLLFNPSLMTLRDVAPVLSQKLFE